MAVLRPLDLKTQPAPYQSRYMVLQKMLKTLEKFHSASPELGKKAVEIEAAVAKKSASSQSYRFNASVVLRDILKSKGKLDCLEPSSKKRGTNASAIKLTKSQAMEALQAVLVDQATLAANGYNTGGVSEIIEQVNDTDNQGIYTTCIRCNTKFRKDQIMSPTTCRFHVQRKKYNRETRQGEYACCGETTSSSSFLALGCKTLVHHVFRAETFSEMERISPFHKTSQVQGKTNVLALDCEMAFTSCGYELIRLTIVDFFTSKVLYDEIVRPFGEVIDLNSEFSGVHVIKEETSVSFSEMLKKILHESLINKNSILIGHGLENDLNVMRLIHDKIIDTAILYPRGHYKSSLKDLAFEVVSRRIQTGEHDSSEDAIATMSVLKSKLGIPLAQDVWE
ncbi:LAQU0S25e00210g1_1 [Lachancea quebecensis]|uniref:RNA exonuclease 3 n=1 Tax=Lachancea quebecensis TaxID=1654605 RepID=A0A0P1KY75_9SACH|nr:LAQU0S25e00210g1_1 [Lachancea quebecensis]